MSSSLYNNLLSSNIAFTHLSFIQQTNYIHIQHLLFFHLLNRNLIRNDPLTKTLALDRLNYPSRKCQLQSPTVPTKHQLFKQIKPWSSQQTMSILRQAWELSSSQEMAGGCQSVRLTKLCLSVDGLASALTWPTSPSSLSSSSPCRNRSNRRESPFTNR